MSKKAKAGGWMAALEDQDLDVKNARDALQVKGWLDTGIYALNWAVSGQLLHGWPLGHTGVIAGDPSTGKSFIASRAIALCQAKGGVALLDDAEGAYNAEHSQRIGINVDELAYARSHTVNDHLKVARAFVGGFDKLKPPMAICVLDSLAQLTTEHELEQGLDKRDMTKAPELKAFYRIMGKELFDRPVFHLATNHIIAAIGNAWQPRTTSGGGGPKFTASVMIDLRATSKIKVNDEVVGTLCRAVINKNRIAAPWKECQFAIPFEGPVARASGLIPLLVKLGLLEERGQFLFFQGQRVGRAYKSKEKFLQQDELGEELVANNPTLLEEADKLILEGKVTTIKAAEATEDDGSEE